MKCSIVNIHLLALVLIVLRQLLFICLPNTYLPQVMSLRCLLGQGSSKLTSMLLKIDSIMWENILFIVFLLVTVKLGAKSKWSTWSWHHRGLPCASENPSFSGNYRLTSLLKIYPPFHSTVFVLCLFLLGLTFASCT